MTIEEKMNITTWRARQLAYLEELYAPREHMGKLMSHLGAPASPRRDGENAVICKQCGASFSQRTVVQKFCSKKCCWRYHKTHDMSNPNDCCNLRM